MTLKLKPTLGMRLRQARIDLEVSLKEASADLGISLTQLHYLETDRVDPSSPLYQRLVEYYGLGEVELELYDEGPGQ